MDSSIANNSSESHAYQDVKRNFVYASKAIPCPICNKTDWCSLELDDDQQPFLAVCGRNVEPPDDWIAHGPSKDGRVTFIKAGRVKRKHFPSVPTLKRMEKGDIPRWKPTIRQIESLKIGDLVRTQYAPGHGQLKKILQSTGKGGQRAVVGPWQYESVGNQEVFLSDIVAIHTDDTDGSEETIEYLYPSSTGEPFGKVIRTQWTDRRVVYQNNRRNKLVIPYHWTSEYQEWKKGKGKAEWPLYREAEAKETIINGGVVFAVAGEQAVECYRELGLTAVCTTGGEHRWKEIVDILEPAFLQAKEHMKQPLLVIHPDFDIVGETAFATKMLERCRYRKVPAVVINPLDLWNKMPHKGDIKDWLDTGIDHDTATRILATAIETATEYEERELEGRYQREAWNAPSSHKGELGYWKPIGKKEDPEFEFLPKADFDFQIERILADKKGGGLLLQFKKADDRHQRRIFIKSTDYGSATKFSDALKRALCCGIVCNLTNGELQALIRVRENEYRITRRGKIFRLVERVGQQSDGVWVFPNAQLSATGDYITEEDSRWCWHSDDGEGGNHLPTPRIQQPNPDTLTHLVKAMHQAYGPELIHHCLLTLGYAAATAHYKAIMEHDRCFPLYCVYADASCGKTTMAECAISMFGMLEEGIVSKITTSAMFEKLKLAGSLLYCLDDPQRSKDPESEEALKSIYNGHPRTVRGADADGFNTQKPHSPLMITANAPLGETSQALKTRMIQIFIPKRDDIDRDAFPPLRAMLKDASGALPTLIKFGYDPEAIQALEERLRPLMPHANGRFPQSLALILHYAEKVSLHAGLDVDIQSWVEQNICPEFNDVEQSGSSIRDFLEKLFVLKAEAKIGEWNVRIVNHKNSPEAKGLAIHMASVWPHLDQAYSLPYNRKIIERQFIDKGATKEVQKFHENRDVSITYSRAGQGNKVNLHPRKCLLIPIEIVKKFSDIGVTGVTEVTEEERKSEVPAQQEIGWLPNINNNKVTNNNKKVTRGDCGEEGDVVTFPGDHPLPVPLPKQETDENLSSKGYDQFGYPVTPVTQEIAPPLKSEFEWIPCDTNHKPPIGAHVRIVAGKQKGKTATVARLHAVQVGVKLDSGVSTLEDYSNLEMILDRDDFIAIDGKLYKIVMTGIKYLVVVKGDRGRKQFAYTRKTKELREMKGGHDE